MALITKKIMLDITPGAIPQTVNVSQRDTGRRYEITLIDEGGVFQIPSGTVAKVEGTIAAYPFSEDAVVSGNTVSFQLKESMTAVSGMAWTKIVLTKGTDEVGTCAFILNVDRAGVEAKTIINAPGFLALLQSAVDKWMESQDGIGEAVQEAANAYAEEHGITPGVVTVNGKDGAVTITAEELGAITDVSDKANTDDVNAALARKQNALVAGDNITLSGNTISATVNAETIAAYVTSWLAANVNPTGSAVVVDSSLSVEGAAADAKATGNLKSALLLDWNKAPTIPDNADFDSYLSAGNYKVVSYANAKTMANIPEKSAGRLTVMPVYADLRVVQIYITIGKFPNIWMRRYSDSWEAWTQIQTANALPTYWEEPVIQAADAINNQRAVTINGTDYTIDSGLSGDRFVFVTDVHWTWGAKHTPQIIHSLLNEVGKMKVFHGGDIVDGALSGVGESATDAEKQERQNYYKRLLCETKAALDADAPMYYCIGNHEFFNPNQAAAFVDWQLTYDEVYRSVVSGMGEQIIDHDDLGDYCFDNATNKIRYFFIASDPAAQIAAGSATWLASALDEMPEGYTAIIVSHVALNTVINEDSSSAHYGEVVPLTTFNKIVNVLEAAKISGIDIGFVISGHTHVDRHCYTDGGILIVTTATDAYRKTKEGGAEDGATREGYNTMTSDTATEHCFDVVSFDTVNRVVALTRVGAGSSRAFTF